MTTPGSAAAAAQFDPSTMNYASLDAPISRAELRRLKLGLKRTPGLVQPNTVLPIVGSVASLVYLTLAGLLVLAMGVAFIFMILNLETTSLAVTAVIGVIVIAGVIAALVWMGRSIGRSWNFTNYWKKWFRLSKFGGENGFNIVPLADFNCA